MLWGIWDPLGIRDLTCISCIGRWILYTEPPQKPKSGSLDSVTMLPICLQVCPPPLLSLGWGFTLFRPLVKPLAWLS